MAPPLLFAYDHLDFDKPQFTTEDIEAVNPHRGAMRMLDAIVWAPDDYSAGVGYKDVRDDEFWVEGHIPGRPVFPGVLMLEAAAQMASFLSCRKLGNKRFLGFVGVDSARFRGQVEPHDRMVILAKEISFKPRRFSCDVQGFVDGSLVFNSVIQGMPI